MSTLQVVERFPSIISGAIHPSVPATPDLLEKDIRPNLSFLHSPKSEIMARTSPFFPGIDIRTLWGLMSRCTMSKLKLKHIILFQFLNYLV